MRKPRLQLLNLTLTIESLEWFSSDVTLISQGAFQLIGRGLSVSVHPHANSRGELGS